MQRITDKKEPEIIMTDPASLQPADLFRLVHIYQADRGEFSIISRNGDVVLINRNMEHAKEVREITAEYMKTGTPYRRLDILFKEIGRYAGKKGQTAIVDARLRWIEMRELADRKEEAERIIAACRKGRILQKAKKEKEMLEMIHNIGSGVYDKEPSCDFSKGNEYCYAYGYLKALQSMG